MSVEAKKKIGGIDGNHGYVGLNPRQSGIQISSSRTGLSNRAGKSGHSISGNDGSGSMTAMM